MCINNRENIQSINTKFRLFLHFTFHSSSINDIAFNEYGKINDICYTVDDHGNLFEYDLNDFNVLGIIPANDDENANSVNIPKATSVYIGDDESIYIGYSNGNLKNFSKDLSLKLFDIPTHKGNINCIYVDGNYILTGGEDGIIRVWTRRTHELIIQVPAHHSNVRCLFADINSPNLIYSCGDDRELICFDLKLQKRQNNQSINNGYLTGISQIVNKEYEIISCGINCNLYVWDFYKSKPIKEINLNENMMAVKFRIMENFLFWFFFKKFGFFLYLNMNLWESHKVILDILIIYNGVLMINKLFLFLLIHLFVFGMFMGEIYCFLIFKRNFF